MMENQLFLKHSSEPVSYTHLDVYKRQVQRQKKTGFLLQMHVFNVESAKIFVRKSVLQSMWSVSYTHLLWLFGEC